MIDTSARDSGPFKRFCVVGLGNHARTKLIPALLANGQQIVGLVTSQCGGNLPPSQVFRSVEDALKALPSDTAFVIATPPALHFAQAMAVIEAGRDLFLEKPAFVTWRDASEVIDAAARCGTVVVEGFMYRYTKLYRRAQRYWQAERASVRAVEAVFLVPSQSAGSFRHQRDVASSSLYDIGCYALSLFVDMNIGLHNLEIAKVAFAGDCEREALSLTGAEYGVRLAVRVGVGPVYENWLSIRDKHGQTETFSPFFYGRTGDRVISHALTSGLTDEIVPEHNAFQEMFLVPRGAWLGDQAARGLGIIEVTGALERLGNSLSVFRNNIRS
jgi:hypothetical protein